MYSSASAKSAYSSLSFDVTETPDFPEARIHRVSFVLVSPSTLIMLKVLSATSLRRGCKREESMSMSVVINESIVAMLGLIIPLPLAIPPSFTCLSPTVYSKAICLSLVSVVIIAAAAQ